MATVNADGSPNLANFVPYPAGEEYLAFTFSSNVTKENLLRTGEAMVSYYIYDADAEDKYERNPVSYTHLDVYKRQVYTL